MIFAARFRNIFHLFQLELSAGNNSGDTASAAAVEQFDFVSLRGTENLEKMISVTLFKFDDLRRFADAAAENCKLCYRNFR